MAYLTKQQYDRRKENAAKRSIENESIAVENGMTQEQAELVSELCSVRHELHTNMDSVTKADNNNIKNRILNINALLNIEGLATIEGIPTSTEDYIDIDTIDELYEIEDIPSDEAERQDWYDSNYERIYAELEQLNKNIEVCLAAIDIQYKTHYAPTGALRIM